MDFWILFYIVWYPRVRMWILGTSLVEDWRRFVALELRDARGYDIIPLFFFFSYDIGVTAAIVSLEGW